MGLNFKRDSTSSPVRVTRCEIWVLPRSCHGWRPCIQIDGQAVPRLRIEVLVYEPWLTDLNNVHAADYVVLW